MNFQVLCFSGYSGFMFLMTLYLEVYLKLSLKKTSVSLLLAPSDETFLWGLMCQESCISCRVLYRERNMPT